MKCRSCLLKFLLLVLCVAEKPEEEGPKFHLVNGEEPEDRSITYEGLTVVYLGIDNITIDDETLEMLIKKKMSSEVHGKKPKVFITSPAAPQPPKESESLPAPPPKHPASEQPPKESASLSAPPPKHPASEPSDPEDMDSMSESSEPEIHSSPISNEPEVASNPGVEEEVEPIQEEDEFFDELAMQEAKLCVPGKKCYDKEDCGEKGDCPGKRTCECLGCPGGAICEGDYECGGFRGACDVQKGHCDCEKGARANGFENHIASLSTICNANCRSRDDCFGLKCIPGACMCLL